MSKRGISAQEVVSKVLQKTARRRPNRISATQWAIFCRILDLGHAKVWPYLLQWPKPGTLGAYLGKKRPENGPYRDRTQISSTRPVPYV
jgi:hypothetical protein